MSGFKQIAASRVRSARITSRLLARPEPSFKSSAFSVWQSRTSKPCRCWSFSKSACSIWSSEMKLGMGGGGRLGVQFVCHSRRGLDVEVFDQELAGDET